MNSSSFMQKKEKLVSLTKEQISDAVTIDTSIIQTLHAIDELTSTLNTLSKRLRDWYGYTFPELENAVSDHETFVRLVAQYCYDELMQKYSYGASMGKKPEAVDEEAQKSFATHIASLFTLKQSLTHYLELTLAKHCQNLVALGGATITARLLASAGSLRQLALLPASTIQLLGAEKALFRHLKTGAKSPKHGFIINHQLLQKSRAKERGKIARALADKLSLCAKIDYFRTQEDKDAQATSDEDLAGKVYLKQLEEKFLGAQQ
ncbi:MAG: hypothetical protein ACLFNM_01420 [Candidatus Woesearchaeota archaeon]